MKKTITIIGLCMLFGCGNSPESSNQEVAQDTLVKDQAPPFEMNENAVKADFLAFLPSVSGGRPLNTFNEKMDKGIIIRLGDIDNDGDLDAVVDYSLEPTLEDTGGGNAIGEVSGVVIYLNTGEKMERVYHSQDYGHGDLDSITDGKIIFKTLEYADTEPRCCPSINAEVHYFWDNENKKMEEEVVGC